ncbi:MAG: Outer membrane protein OprJ [Herbaspirillum frisingense]|uniref:Outer membrane protein OprJ n=1 Tax=Herbaspirillum frisingense TaxID=92645 RepID=A0A7V8FYL8_9BURK|nr:MAG: Outer membrane protein OprJ [Herbaspirillum frisingense]
MGVRLWPLLPWCGPLLLIGCATGQLPPQVDAQAPSSWREAWPDAPLPHQGEPARLQEWWRGYGDAALTQLIDAAQRNSPSLAAARTRMAQAGADHATAWAALRPRLDGQVAVVRESVHETGRRRTDLASTAQLGLQASWDLDLAGGQRAARHAAMLRAAGATRGWHAARVAVAAETAQYYFALRHCRRQNDLMRQEAAAQRRVEALSAAMAQAGMEAALGHAQESARSAQSDLQVADLGARCKAEIKSLTALTGVDETELHVWLDEAGELPDPDAGAFRLQALPAQLLRQRPDVLAAESDVAAASAEFDQVQRSRYPRLTLRGTIGVAKSRAGDSGAGTFTTWNLGPLALDVPLYDGGAHGAAVEASQARYAEAVSHYRASVRKAVADVETALLELNAGAERSRALQALLRSRDTELRSARAAYRAGLASEAQWRQAQRSWLAGRIEEGERRHQRRMAWLALYRAVGGGWQAAG